MEILSGMLIPIVLLVLLCGVIAYGKDNMKNPGVRFFVLLVVGVICSWIPFGPLSVVFGFPAVLLNAIIVTFVLEASKKKEDTDVSLSKQ